MRARRAEGSYSTKERFLGFAASAACCMLTSKYLASDPLVCAIDPLSSVRTDVLCRHSRDLRRALLKLEETSQYTMG